MDRVRAAGAVVVLALAGGGWAVPAQAAAPSTTTLVLSSPASAYGQPVTASVQVMTNGPADGDVFLGVPFNIASYALLTMMVAQVTGLKPGDFVHSLGDAHLYSNHLEQARLQLTRPTRQLPVMKIAPDVKDIFSFRYEDFVLEGYDPHPHIKAEVAV